VSLERPVGLALRGRALLVVMGIVGRVDSGDKRSVGAAEGTLWPDFDTYE